AGSRAAGQILRVSGGHDVLRGRARTAERRRHVIGEIEDRRRKIRQKVRRRFLDERAFPVYAAGEERWKDFDCAAHLVPAVRGTDSVYPPRLVAVARLYAALRKHRSLRHETRPPRELLPRVIVVEMDEERRRRVEPACQWIGHRTKEEIEHALVLRSVRVPLLDDVVTPSEIAIEFAARPGCTCDHETTVPSVR